MLCSPSEFTLNILKKCLNPGACTWNLSLSRIDGVKLVPVLSNVASKMKVIALLNLGLLDKDSPVIKGLQSTDLQVLAESW